MKIGWIVAAIVGLAVVVLLLARGGRDGDVRVARGGPAERAAGGASDDAGGLDGSADGSRRGTRQSLPPDGAASSGRAGSAAAPVGGSRAATGPAAGGSATGRSAASGTAAGVGAGGRRSDSAAARVEGSLDAVRKHASDATRREAPEAGSTGPVLTYDAEGNEVIEEPVPEVAFDGGDERVFPIESQEDLQDAGPIGGDAGTISFWLKPEWGSGNQQDATFVQLGDSGLEIIKNVNFLRFQFHDSAGGENGLGANMDAWPTNQWRHISASWANNQLSLYIDGKLVSQNRYALAPEFQEETKIYVGSAYPSGAAAAPASITSLRVLNRDTSAGEALQHFSQGPPRPK